MTTPNIRSLWFLLVPALVLAVWLALYEFGNVPAIILPSPAEVGRALVAAFDSGGMLTDVGWTLLRTVLGFLVGTAFGVLLGLAMGSWRSMHDTMVFSVDAIRSIPATSLFPLFMLTLGLGLKSMVALIAFPTCWLVTINTMYGVHNSSLIRREMAEIFRVSSPKRFFFVTLPDAAPAIVASLRLSIAICLHMAIIGEIFMGTETGIGRRIYDAHTLLRVPEVYAAILTAGILGYTLNSLLVLMEKKLFFWGGK